MNLSIIIPTSKNSSGLDGLLSSLEIQDLSPEEFEVIIVFSGRAIRNISLKNNPKITILQSPRGANKARNKGLSVARSEFVLFLDDDTYLQDSTYLTTILKYAHANPALAAIGGTYKLSGRKGYFDHAYANVSEDWQKSNTSQNLVGGNSLYCFKKIEHYLRFNENISFGATETELNLRLIQMGFQLKVFEELVVEHKTQISFWGFIKKAFLQGMGHHYIERVLLKNKKNITQTDSRPVNHLYQFFYRVGYRYGRKNLDPPLKPLLIFSSLFSEFFQIESELILAPKSNQDTYYHLTKYPVLKFRQIYHWVKGNFWRARWRFFWFLKWRLFPLLIMFPIAAAWMLFPFNLIGLSTPYDNLLKRFKL